MFRTGYNQHFHAVKKGVKRDSSVKRTRLHYLSGGRLGAWAVNHAIRRNRRVPESGVNQRTDGGQEDYPHAIDFAQFMSACGIKGISVAVR